jgi:dolichol-phosphate mannosyltransferase
LTSGTSRRVYIVVPAFNEAENLPELLTDLIPRARELDARIIFVDDGSTDATRDVLAEARDGYPVTLLRHGVNLGLGRTIDSGMRLALESASDDDAIVTIEADNTTDLDDLLKMLARFDEGYDLVVGSPYAKGGRMVGVGWLRLFLSRTLSAAFRILGRLREVHTFSTVYRVYRAGPLRRAFETYGYLLVREPGYAASVELLLKLRNAGARVGEVPTTNDWTHRHGTSKMRIRPTLLAYFRLVAAHLIGVIQPPPYTPLAEERDGRLGATVEELEAGAVEDSNRDRAKLAG